MRPPLALVVIEDPDLRRQVEAAVAQARGRSVHAEDEAALLRSLDRQAFSMVFTAAGPGGPPLDRVLLAAHRRRPDAPVIVVGALSGAHGRDEDEVFELVSAPIDPAQLDGVVRRAAMQHELLAEVTRLRGLCGAPDPLDPLVGRSEAMAILRERITAAAARERAVLLVGEQGTGRGLVARTIHAISSRRSGPFVTLAGFADDVDLDEVLDRALGGTLFVSDVDRLEANRQRRLAAAIGARFGADEARRVASASDGRLDDELGALLTEEILRVPPLRDRDHDVPLIARRHLETLCALNGLPPARLDPAALALLESHTWPGNVAQLRETVERALTLAADGVIRSEHLSEDVRASSDPARGEPAGRAPRRFRDAKRRIVDSFERSYLEELLGWHLGNVTAAAEQAGMLRSALQRLLRKHDLRSSDFRGNGRGGSWRSS